MRELPGQHTSSEVLKAFHRFWLAQAQKSLDLEFKLRRIRALNFALNQEEFESFVSQLNDFAISVLSKYNHANLEGRRLYMFQSVLFPSVERAYYATMPESDLLYSSEPSF